MTVAEIESRIARIAKLGDKDPEQAHLDEDDLYLAVLRAIAAGAPDAPVLAQAALKANELDFSRWYA